MKIWIVIAALALTLAVIGSTPTTAKPRETIIKVTRGRLLDRFVFSGNGKYFYATTRVIDAAATTTFRDANGELRSTDLSRLDARDTTTGEVLDTDEIIYECGNRAETLDISPDGKQMVLNCATGGGFQVIDLISSKMAFQIFINTPSIHAILFSPDGKNIAMQDIYGVRTFSSLNGKEIDNVYANSEFKFLDAVYRKDGSLVVASTGWAAFYDPKNVKKLQFLESEYVLRYPNLNLDATGKFLVATNTDNSYQTSLFETYPNRTGKFVRFIRGNPPPQGSFQSAFSLDGKTLALGVGVRDSDVNGIKIGKGSVLLFDTKTWKRVGEFKDYQIGLTFSPDGSRLIYGGANNTIHIWTLK
jgi:WD40 repeat protein